MRLPLLVTCLALASCADAPVAPEAPEVVPESETPAGLTLEGDTAVWIIRVEQVGDSLIGRAEQDTGDGLIWVFFADGNVNGRTLTLRMSNVLVPK